jgi:hypothetical protein
MNRPSRKTHGLLLALLASLAYPGCEPFPGNGAVVEVRDSAGIVVVENRGSSGPDGVWQVDPNPFFSIGTFQGDSLYQLYEVSGAVRLPDGRIAVANRGSGEIRIYDVEGQFLVSHGQKGEGPGEFQAPSLVGVVGGDTLVVIDSRLRRVSLLDAEAGFSGSARIEDDVGGALYPQGIFFDRTVLVGGGFYWSSDSGDELTDGYTRPPTSYQSLHLDGTLGHDFGEFPGSEFFMEIRRSGGRVAMSARLIPFGRFPMVAVAPGSMYFGSGDSWEVKGYAPDGSLERLIRWDRPAVPVTASSLDAHIREQEGEAEGNEAREIRERISEMPVPETMPAFGGLHVDELGYLWVERFRSPEDHVPTFDIFQGEGTLVARAILPVEAEVLQIREDEILTLYRDDLGVEYLRLYSLRRRSGS